MQLGGGRQQAPLPLARCRYFLYRDDELLGILKD
jgi:hypothetical protein